MKKPGKKNPEIKPVPDPKTPTRVPETEPAPGEGGKPCPPEIPPGKNPEIKPGKRE